MSYGPTEDQIEWHMQQLRQWIAPTTATMPQKGAYPSSFPQDFYVQNVPAYYDCEYEAPPMQQLPQAPIQRAHTLANMSSYDFNYSCWGNPDQFPRTPSSCPADDSYNFDDVNSVSCYSETASSYLSSDVPEHTFSEPISIKHNSRATSVTSHPSSVSLPTSAPKVSCEVDALMKTLQPPGPPPMASSLPLSQPLAPPAAKMKKYPCPLSDCNKSFSQPTHMRIHLRSHTGEKPYTCSVPTCGQSFSQLGNLRTHERRHIGQRPNRKRASSDPGARARKYECILDGCRGSNGTQALDPSGKGTGKVFTQLGNLKAHMNKFHKETLAKLSEQFCYGNEDVECGELVELKSYFQSLFKNSNKGIKGRGKGRTVEVINDNRTGLMDQQRCLP